MERDGQLLADVPQSNSFEPHFAEVARQILGRVGGKKCRA